jgi:hypothetical protein
MDATAKNTINLLIGNDIARTASLQVSDRVATTYLADGEIVVLDENDAVLAPGSTYTDSKFIRVIQRSGATASSSELVRSLVIDGRSVLKYSGSSYSAPQTQRYYFGFDGATGSIDNINSNDYTLRLTFKHEKTVFSQQANTQAFYFPSDAAATEEEIAGSFARQVGDSSGVDMLAERLCDNAGAALVGTLIVTNGSKIVTANSTETNIAVNTYIRIGGTALTDPVYKVTAFSGNTITLDENYQGASAAAATGEYITAALAAAAAFGVQLTGDALEFRTGYLEYNQVSWDMTLSGFGATTTNLFREALLGSGTYEQIAEKEWFAQGYDGIIDRVGDTAPILRADATVGQNYDVIQVAWADASDDHVISGTKPSHNQLMIALPDGASQAGDILGQLNPWMASLPGAFTAATV